MDLSRFNKWTQYLKRDILMEMCEMHCDEIVAGPITYCHDIACNPNFDLARYTAVFPEIKWNVHMPTPPFTYEEFDVVVEVLHAHNPSDMAHFACRVTHEQLDEVPQEDFDVFMSYADTSVMLDFAENRYITMADALRMLPFVRGQIEECVNLLDALVHRRDLTVEAARKIVAFVSSTNTDPEERAAALDGIASNCAINMEHVVELCGRNCSDVMLNCDYTRAHASAAQVRSKLLAANPNFPTNMRETKNPLIAARNPRVQPRDLKKIGKSYSPISLFRNEYTQHPCWRAECQRREAARADWLAVAWAALAAHMMPEIAALVLEIWYAEVGYTTNTTNADQCGYGACLCRQCTNLWLQRAPRILIFSGPIMSRAEHVASMEGLKKARNAAIIALEQDSENKAALEEIAAYSKLIANHKHAIDAAPVAAMRECGDVIKYLHAQGINLRVYDEAYFNMWISDCSDVSMKSYADIPAVLDAMDMVVAIADDAVADPIPRLRDAIYDMQSRRNKVMNAVQKYINTGVYDEHPYKQKIHEELVVSQLKSVETQRNALRAYGAWVYEHDPSFDI